MQDIRDSRDRRDSQDSWDSRKSKDIGDINNQMAAAGLRLARKACEEQSSNHHVIYLCICPPASQPASQPNHQTARTKDEGRGARDEKRWSPRAIDTALRQTGWQGNRTQAMAMDMDMEEQQAA
ncbi:GD24588 [Drosophila simulans]|uniref:GD24588 n=1 Tax=Drosophila simulans TaxID=7240 RepID=B4NU30_DROSI|nr:GD24588 [Drosophila simulans]